MGALAGVTDRIVDLPSGRVFVRDSGGTGVPVVFLHPNNGMMWDQQVSALVNAGYRFVAIDYRGVDNPAYLTSEGRVEEAVTKLRLGWFHVVGTGGGSVIATQFALDYPAQVRSLTIGNSLAGLKDIALNEMEQRLRSPQFDAMPREWRELGPTYRALHPDGVNLWLDMANSTPQMVLDAQKTAQPAKGGPPAPATSPPAAVTWDRLDQLKAPVEIVTGDADPYTPPGILWRFAERMKGSKGVVIPDSGHTAYWENPTAYNQNLLEFLAKH